MPGRLAGDVRSNATRTGATVRMGPSVNQIRRVDQVRRRLETPAFGHEVVCQGRALHVLATKPLLTTPSAYSKASKTPSSTFNWTNTTTTGSGVHD